MRAGVGHGAMAQIVHEIFQFRTGQRIIRLYGMAANGLGHGMFSQTHRVDFLAGGFEFIDQLQRELSRVGDFDERGQGIEKECPLTEFIQSDA